ncbi:MAG: class A beta-lactamase-related serine hydrolase [Sphingomonadales bacterium]|nr:MAG: class A beta-lactamase-related serine hydrolase [Sphingomonadales bacterium]
MLSRRNVIAVGATLTALPASAQSSTPAVADAAVALAVEEAINAHACPGVSVAIGQAGTLRVSQGFGMANLETQSAISEKSIFRLASLTKQFTAAAIIKLASLGRLDVRAHAATYLPGFKALKPFTLLELMNHTAGLHSDEGGEAGSSVAMPAKTQIELANHVARQPKPFDFDPGTAWLYSNANYIVLGAIIESVTNMPFDRAMSELVFAPLGLASLAIDKPSEIVTGRVSGYSPVEGRTVPFENAAYLDVSQAGGAGAMRGTAIDLCRWHDALLGHRLFDRAHTDLMLTPGRLRNGRPSGTNRFSPGDAGYGDVEYACGLLVSGPSEPNANILHYGAINGFAALLQTYTKSRTTFAVLCNGDTGPALPFRSIRKAVVARYLS